MLSDSVQLILCPGARPPKVQVRIAGPSDAEPACEVLRRSIAECCYQDHRNDHRILSKWLGNKTPDTVASWFAFAGNHALLAYIGSDIVGVGLLTRAGRIGLCYVAPERRFSGAGTALLAGMESKAREWQLSVVSVDSTITARDFYLCRGYFAGETRRAKSGIAATALWKYLDEDLPCNASGPRTVGPPCRCASADSNQMSARPAKTG